MSTIIHNPFPGPQPYTKDASKYYFGRDEEALNLMSVMLVERCATLHGPSGSGKSSIMQAFIQPKISEGSSESTSRRKYRFVLVDRWPPGQAQAPVDWLVEQLNTQLGLEAQPGSSPDGRLLSETMRRAGPKPVFIYLDQVEQILIRCSKEQTESLVEQLDELLEEPSQELHLVLGIREDYLSRWREFVRGRSRLIENWLRLGYMTVGEFKGAACEAADRGEPWQVWDEKAIQKILAEVRINAPTQASGSNLDNDEIHAAYGQIVCRALFEKGGPGQTASEMSAKHIVEEYLDNTLRSLGPLEERARRLLEERLVANDGKRTLLTEAQARQGVSEEESTKILDTLEKAAILRAQARMASSERFYELGHDWLAEKVFERRGERIEAEERAKERRERRARERRERRRLIGIAVLAVVVAVVVGVVGVVVWGQRSLALRAQTEAARERDAAEVARKDAQRASRMAGVRELMASGKLGMAAMALAAVDEPERARGWVGLAIELLAQGFESATLHHEGEVKFAAWSPDGKRIVTASSDKTAAVWNADGSGESVVLKGHTSVVTSAAWSPDGERIVTASEDKTARMWNADGSGELTVIKRHESTVTSAAWSPDGKRIVTASNDYTARVWNADGSGESVVLKGHEGMVNSAAWSADGKHIVTASYDKTARVWNADGSGESIIIKGHTAPVNSASFSPDGKRIVTASDDKTARIWLIDIPLLQQALRSATTDCLTPAQRELYLLETASDAATNYATCERSHGRTPRL